MILFASLRSQHKSQLHMRGLPKRLMDKTWEEGRLHGGKELKLQLKHKKSSQALKTKSKLFPESHGGVPARPFCQQLDDTTLHKTLK